LAFLEITRQELHVIRLSGNFIRYMAENGLRSICMDWRLLAFAASLTTGVETNRNGWIRLPAALGWLCDTIDLLVRSFGHGDEGMGIRSGTMQDLFIIQKLSPRLHGHAVLVDVTQ
jgi:hypothetical protein